MLAEHERSQLIAKYISLILQLKFDSGTERAHLGPLVDIVNTLLVPKAWIGIDDEGLLHVTYMTSERHEPNGKVWKPGLTSLMMSADYAWEYIPWKQAYRCLKCRTDDFSKGQIVKAIDAVDLQKCNPGPH